MKKKLRVVVFCCVALAGVAAFFLHEFSPGCPVLCVLNGAGGDALLITDGFQDRGASLFVRDAAVSEDPILIGQIDWPDRHLYSVDWSKDHQVIAIRSRLGEKMPGKVVYLHAYDFGLHQRLAPTWEDPSSSLTEDTSPEAAEAQNEGVLAMLNRHGGALMPSATAEDLEGKSHFLWSWQRGKFLNQ